MTNQYDPTYTPSYEGTQMRSADDDHLRVLVICHYVWAGMSAFFGLFPAIYIVMGIFVLTGAIPTSGGSGSVAPMRSVRSEDQVMGTVFIIVGSLLLLFFQMCALLTLLAGRAISKRRRYMLVMISSGLNCLFMPIGTVLGIFTFVVMCRPTVRAKFPR